MVKRPDGTMQVAYNDHPLYTFKLDKSAGTINEDSAQATVNWWVDHTARLLLGLPPADPT